MINDFKAGTKVCQAVLLRVQKIGNSSNGGVFARGLLEDNSGKMPFIVFEAGIVDKMRSMEGPKVMMVGGMVDINKFSCLLYTSPSPRDTERSRMPSSA